MVVIRVAVVYLFNKGGDLMTKVKDITHTRRRQIIEDVDIDIYKRIPQDTCYFCGAEDDEGVFRSDFYTNEFPQLLVDVHCEACGKMWHEVYELKELWIRTK
jgi:hypothetical protein